MLLSLYVSTFAIRASFAIMLIVFPLYILSLKSYFLFGIVLSSSPAFELITVLGLGAYIDRHGRKNVLLIGLLTGSVALWWCYFHRAEEIGVRAVQEADKPSRIGDWVMREACTQNREWHDAGFPRLGRLSLFP